MADRYMIAMVMNGKVVEYYWYNRCDASFLVMHSLWYVAMLKDCKTIEELYKRMCIKESCEERTAFLSEVIPITNEQIIIDFDNKNVYFGVHLSLPYEAEQYKDWPIASFDFSPDLFNPKPFDPYSGTGVFGRQRVPFNSFNHKLLISYCKDYKGWDLSDFEPKDTDESEASVKEDELDSIICDNDFDDNFDDLIYDDEFSDELDVLFFDDEFNNACDN